MGLIDELERLEQLKQRSSITDSEFEQSKITLLSGSSNQTHAAPTISDSKTQQRVTDLEKEVRVQELRRKLLELGQRGVSRVNWYMGWISCGIGIFCAFWSLFFLFHLKNTKSELSFLLTILFIGLFIFGTGIYSVMKFKSYKSELDYYNSQIDNIYNSNDSLDQSPLMQMTQEQKNRY
jgi:hypothetical protein